MIAGRTRGGLLGKAEVEDLDASIFGQEKIVGLDIAMRDSFKLGGGETGGDLAGIIDGARGA